MHIVNKRIKTVGNNGELLFIPHRNFAKVFDTRKTRVIGLQSSEEIMTRTLQDEPRPVMSV